MECNCFNPNKNIEENLRNASTRDHIQCVSILITHLKSMEGSYDHKRALITNTLEHTIKYCGNNSVLGRNEIVNILVQAKAYVYKLCDITVRGEPLLMSRTGDIWLVQKLVGWGADIERTDSQGQTALIYAAAGTY